MPTSFILIYIIIQYQFNIIQTSQALKNNRQRERGTGFIYAFKDCKYILFKCNFPKSTHIRKHSKHGTFILFHSASQVKTPDCVQLNRIDSQDYNCSFNYSALIRVWLSCIFSNFTRLAVHWFHPGVDSFPVFVVAAFSFLSCTSRTFLPFRLCLLLHAGAVLT